MEVVMSPKSVFRFQLIASILFCSVAFAQSIMDFNGDLFQTNYLTSINDALIGYYPFNGNANDESGYGDNGIVYGAQLTEDRFGSHNSAYYFNGESSYIVIPKSSILEPNDFTIAMYMKTKSLKTSTYQTLIIKDDGWNDGFKLALRSELKDNLANKILLTVSGPINNGDALANLHSKFIIQNTDTWYHVVATYKGGGMMKIYINGSFDSQMSGPPSWDKENSHDLVIGRHSNHGGTTYGGYFFGALDDIRMYNRALTDEEVLQLYDLDQSENHDGLDIGIKSVTGLQPFIRSEKVVPAFTIKNYGNITANNIWAQCLIDSSGIIRYHSITRIDQIRAADTCVVQFEPWIPFTPSSYHVALAIYLVGDLWPANNYRSISARTVLDYDVSIANVIVPGYGEYLSTSFSPEIEVENIGTHLAESFEAVCEITNHTNLLLYRSAYLITELEAQTKKTITFAPWTPSESGPLMTRFELKYAPDQFLGNNVASITTDIISGVSVPTAALPNQYLLAANYPNPFNNSTTIRLNVPSPGSLSMQIFSSIGEPVWTWKAERIEAGEQNIIWHGENDQRETVASGFYFCRVELMTQQGIKQTSAAKMLLLK